MPVDTVAVAPALPEHNDKPPSAGETKKRKKYRLKPGTKALREVRSMQKTTSRCIPVKAFYRIVKDIANEHKSGCKLSMVRALFVMPVFVWKSMRFLMALQ